MPKTPKTMDDVLHWPIDDFCEAGVAPEDGSDDWAVVVGIGQYPGLTHLHGPENDAMDFCRWLRCRAGVPTNHITAITTGTTIAGQTAPLVNGQWADALNALPTATLILSEFQRLTKISKGNADEGNGPRVGRRLYLYFSGHGFEPGDNQPACLMANAEFTLVGPNYHVLGKHNADYFARNRLFDEVILFMDCCREVDATAIPAANFRLADHPDPKVFTAYATRKNRKAREKEFNDNGRVRGIFTRRLLQALEGGADTDGDGIITAQSLAGYLHNVLKDEQAPEVPLEAALFDWELLHVAPPTAPVAPATVPAATVRVTVPPEHQGKRIVLRDGFFKPVSESAIAPPVWETPVTTTGLYLVTVGEAIEAATPPFEISTLQGEKNVTLEKLLPLLNVSGTAPVPVKLRVTASEPLTDLFVIDSNFALVPSGRGQDELTVEVPSGVYKIRARAGNRSEERIVALMPGKAPDPVHFGPVAFSSPAPLEATLTTHEYHQRPAYTCSREINHVAGSGGFLFLMVRNVTEKRAEYTTFPQADPNAPHPGLGLKLYNAEGSLVTNLDTIGKFVSWSNDPKVGQKEEAWWACNLQLTPGVYYLTLDLSGDGVGATHQTLVVSPGWQTQYFANVDELPTGSSYPVADFASASILMARSPDANTPTGFSPNDRADRMTEMARIALAGKRRLLSKELINELLHAKFENPMLGILGANLLLARQEDTREEELRNILSVVVANLRRLVGNEHPDVESLALADGGPGTNHTFPHPPMLSASWRRIVEASLSRPGLMPEGSESYRAAGTIRPGDVWLSWREPTKEAQEGLREIAAFVTTAAQSAAPAESGFEAMLAPSDASPPEAADFPEIRFSDDEGGDAPAPEASSMSADDFLSGDAPVSSHPQYPADNFRFSGANEDLFAPENERRAAREAQSPQENERRREAAVERLVTQMAMPRSRAESLVLEQEALAAPENT